MRSLRDTTFITAFHEHDRNSVKILLVMEPTDVLIAPPLMNPMLDPFTTSNVTNVAASTCPWGKIKNAEVVSFNDVMSEQLISSLVEEKVDPDPSVYVDDFIGCGEIVNDSSDDHMLAKMLQLEFDKEHDEMLRLKESKFNGQSKVKVTFEKFLHLRDENLSSDDDDDDDKELILEQNQKNHWHAFEQAEKTFQAVGKSGVSRHGNVTTTKHDLTVSGRRNAGKLMEFPSCIPTGDGGQFDMKLPNNVFNSLRLYSRVQYKKSRRLHEKKEKSTTEEVLDEKTQMIFFKMLNNQTLDSFTGCISTGKESCVYHALSCPEDESAVPVEYAIKVFKTTLNEYKNRQQYIQDDYRFKQRFSKQNPRKVIHMWAEKEMRNLQRMKKANMSCPDVITLKKHVLVMSFIGKDSLPAPKIKDVELPFELMTIMYEQVVEIMKTLYSDCKLVHADLSEFNLLWHDEKTWVIDVSQAVETTHSQALEFLLRDCTNISSFFDKKEIIGKIDYNLT
ncbi:hypothetical protein NPIL_319581 [Nephila pilipes]|uniref:Serine/threonine-protein kinase RIO3 n=1 Tax=Nephila pilipes TaxID=299642 RepID=A0A8X6PM45_NEPPI|nr:hypothetical protein NPIL_319581 [Nephila pilipes]